MLVESSLPNRARFYLDKKNWTGYISLVNIVR